MAGYFFENNMDLFEKIHHPVENEPLASRMRPSSLDEIVGQNELIGPGKLLRRAIEADRLTSIILFGPSGCGKTTLAGVIASVTKRPFEKTSGVLANVAVLREIIKTAEMRRARTGCSTILFIDEIHRFNKSQQDVLLPFVENGVLTLIGATTHNPQFFINGPLISRSLVFELHPLTDEDIYLLLNRALKSSKGLGKYPVMAEDEALRHIASLSEGDARRALNALEIAVLTTPLNKNDGKIHIDKEVAASSVQKKMVVYDHDEDGHYDTISAFIKSLRGSDPNAAIYWLAKMLYAGEDPRFIARRMIIFASEDIGNADPRALDMAISGMLAVDFVGMPEVRIVLSHVATYLATAPKSNASYLAIEHAWHDVENNKILPVPQHLKNVKVRTDNENKEASAKYKYPHDYEGHVVEQKYVPTTEIYYQPTDQGYEDIIKKRIETWKKITSFSKEKTKNA